MKLEIKDWQDDLIEGIEVEMINEITPEGDYFDWRPSGIITTFSTNAITGGVVEAGYKPVEYTAVEYHDDSEVFYFVDGEGAMLFCDIENGAANLDSAVMLRVKNGMKMSIVPEKAHYVPISTVKGKTVKAVVISPKMNTFKIDLDESVYSE